MKVHSSRLVLLFGLVLLAARTAQGQQPTAIDANQYDVVIYGGTSASITAAVQAKKMGKTVIVVCPDRHLGDRLRLPRSQARSMRQPARARLPL
jgi:hypothetical protein